MCIQRRGSFIEEDNFRILEQNSRNCQPLLLSPANHETTLSNLGLIPRRQLLDGLVDIRLPGGFKDLLVSRIQLPIADVVHNVLVEQRCILRHDANGLAKALELDLGDILVVDENTTR